MMKPILKRWRSWLLLTFLVGFLSLTGLTNSISVMPPRLMFTVDGGDYFEGQIEVYGDPDKEIRVKTYFMDWDLDLEGTVQFYTDPGQVERSATPWLRIEPTEFVLPAGSKKIVTIRGKAVKRARHYYCSCSFRIGVTRQRHADEWPGGSITVTVPER